VNQSACDSCKQVELVVYYQRENERLRAQLAEAKSPRTVEFRGERRTVCQWAKTVGLPFDTVTLRLKRGWSVERALTTSVRSPCRSFERAKEVPSCP